MQYINQTGTPHIMVPDHIGTEVFAMRQNLSLITVYYREY